MPTLEKQISDYRSTFGRNPGYKEHARIVAATTREHGIPCGHIRIIPNYSLSEKVRLRNRAEWFGVAPRFKAMSRDWTLMRLLSQKKQKRQPRTPQNIAEAITASRWILDLKDDWDEQGSPRFKQTTWKRACDFLERQAKVARETFRSNLPAPKILPGPHGSIDVHWKTPRLELLVNVPEDQNKLATFYGDDFGDMAIRGNLNPAEAKTALVAWLLVT